MSLATAGLLFTQSCTIERNAASGGTDKWNQPIKGGWATHLDGQPCCFWATSGGEHVTDATTVVVVEDLRLILQLGTDVTTEDRISAIALEDGTAVAGGPIGIRAILTHEDHLELVLVRLG